MMKPVGQLVRPFVAKYDLERGVQAARVTGCWTAAAASVLGPHIPVPAALCLKDAVLWLELPPAVVAQEIQIAKIQLLEKLAELCGEGTVTDLRFRVGAPSRLPTDRGRQA